MGHSIYEDKIYVWHFSASPAPAFQPPAPPLLCFVTAGACRAVCPMCVHVLLCRRAPAGLECLVIEGGLFQLIVTSGNGPQYASEKAIICS